MSYAFISILIIAVIAAVVFAIGLLRRKPRSAVMRRFGGTLDLEFSEKDNRVLEQLKFFKIYDPKTLQVTAKNTLRSKTRQPESWVFDYDSIVGPANASSRIMQTVFYFRDPRMKVPGFRMFPKKSGIFRRNDTVSKYRPIAFASNPRFSQAYTLVGPDDREIRDIFKPDLLAYFEKLRDIHIEGFDTEVIMYLYKKLIPEKDFNRCFHNAQSIYQLFLHHSAVFRAEKIGMTPFE